MNRGDRPEKRNVRHSPYERVVLPDPIRKDLAKYIGNSSPFRGTQPSRQAVKSRANKSSPVKVKKEPFEPDPQFEREDSPDSGILELSSDGEEDEAILAASRRLAHDTVHDQRKRPKASATNLERRPIGQGMAEPSSSAMDIDKGFREAPRHNYGAVPSSLSAGPSSATWVSRPSEGLDSGSNVQPIDLELFTAEMTSLIDEFCDYAKSKVEEFANRGR